MKLLIDMTYCFYLFLVGWLVVSWEIGVKWFNYYISFAFLLIGCVAGYQVVCLGS